MKLTILAASIMEELPAGASVSVNGACLTVASRTEREFSLEVSPETLSVTSLGSLTVGTPVNLERAMRVADRLGGHLVAGHVDGVGTIRSRRQEGNAIVLTIEAPKEVLRYCVHKGSVTIDGISMTINEVTDHAVSVAVIPHTAKVTTLGLKNVGDPVNLEADLIGKYVERLLQERGHLPSKPTPVIDRDYLQKRGLL
jgi:riboflavin synthase